jgi:hypothetical protein
MKKNLPHRVVPSFERSILSKVCAVEAGNPSEVISGPEELLIVIKYKGCDWSRDSMCP